MRMSNGELRESSRERFQSHNSHVAAEKNATRVHYIGAAPHQHETFATGAELLSPPESNDSLWAIPSDSRIRKTVH